MTSINGPTSVSISKRPAFFILALLAFLTAGLLLLLPGGPVQAQHPGSTSATIPFVENGKAPVQTFTSEDPEDHGIEWSIRGLDAADFTISSSGVLAFNNPPNFEQPTDRELQLNVIPAIETNLEDMNLDGEVPPDRDTYPLTNREYAAEITNTR